MIIFLLSFIFFVAVTIISTQQENVNSLFLFFRVKNKQDVTKLYGLM